MARRPEYWKKDEISREDLKEMTRSLSLLSEAGGFAGLNLDQRRCENEE